MIDQQWLLFRWSELVDKKHTVGLIAVEEEEMALIDKALDAYEGSFYERAIERLERLIKERGG